MAKLRKFASSTSPSSSASSLPSTKTASVVRRWLGLVYLIVFLAALSVALFFGQQWVRHEVRQQRLASLTTLSNEIAAAEKNVAARAAALKLNQGVVPTEAIVKNGNDYQFVLWNGVPALRIRSGLIQLLNVKDWIVQPLPDDTSEMSVMRAGLRFNLRDYKDEQIDLCYLEVSMHVQHDMRYSYARIDQGC